MRIRTPYTYFPFEKYASPVIEVTLSNPVNFNTYGLPMKIDTGAGITAIPTLFLRERMGLEPIGFQSFRDFDGHKHLKPIYIVHIRISDFFVEAINVIDTSTQDFGLLGRDLLHRFQLICDGPKQMCEIIVP